MTRPQPQPAPHLRPQPQPPPDTSSRRWTLAEKMLTVLAAILAVAAALLALQTAQIANAKEQVQASQQTTSSDLSSLQSQFDQLEDRNSELQSENARLRSQLGLPGPSADPEAPTIATVRHSGELTLALNGNMADLDSPASDPQWQTNGYELEYVRSNDKSLILGLYSPWLYLNATEANYDACRNQTGYRNDQSIDTTSIHPGDYMCIKTNEGRYAAMRVTNIEARQITFDVVVYNSPGS